MTVANGVVYYASMDAKGTLFYLEAATGRLLGSFETGATLGCGPSLARGKVFVGALLSPVWVLLFAVTHYHGGLFVCIEWQIVLCDAFYALSHLEAATGRLLGSFDTGATLGPSLACGKVYVGALLVFEAACNAISLGFFGNYP
jgi:outer membrane protein assembly factor BamB